MMGNKRDSGAELGIGERAEADRKRRYWRTLSVISAVGLPLGFVLGTGLARNPFDPGVAFSGFPPAAVIAFLLLSIGGFAWGTYAFTRTVDEVELADNLWGSTAGYYAYAVLLPSWWVLGKAGITGEPNHWAIFATSMAVALAVYGWRKWQAR